MKMPKIEQRGDTYTCRLSYVNEFGRRVQPRLTARTKGELKKLIIDTMDQINKGIFIMPTSDQLGPYLTEWIEGKKNNVRETTYDNYKYVIDQHIVPALGQLKISKITPFQLEKFYDSMKKDYADWTVFRCHAVLNMALTKAKRYKLINDNPAEIVEAPSIQKKQMDYWDEEESINFFNHEEIIKHREYIAFLIPFSLGLRMGEALALKFADIDWEKKTIHVRRMLSKGKIVDLLKTSSSRRIISVDDYTLSLIKRQKIIIAAEKLKATEYHNNDLIVCTKVGTPFNPSNIRRTWDKLVKVSENRRIRYHDLRHTHATLMLQQEDADIKMVSERLGHKNIKVTLETYYHVLPGKQEKAVTQFGASYFGEKRTEKSFSETKSDQTVPK